MKEVLIVSAVRTPIGSFGGSLSSLSAIDLGAIAIKAAIEKAGIKAEQVQEVFMGNVVSANLGQAPAQQAALKAGITTSTPCTTINKVCASGMKAIMVGAQSIMTGENDIVVAGGMESMSNIPYYLPNARNGYRLGNGEMLDGILRDALWDPYKDYHMGNAAEVCAVDYKISREEQDAYAAESYKRAAKAHEQGDFNDEIIPVEVPQKKGPALVVTKDDEFSKVDFEKMLTLKPAFQKEGTVTAANASKINDGAAAVILMSKEKADELGIKGIAKILSFADAQQEPEKFTTTPSLAMPKAAQKAGVKIDQLDAYEINEAFSVVALANNKIMGLDPNKVNIFGGAVSLGHPVGTSGARIIATLISALKKNGGKIGAAGICNGGGGASAMILERL
ncbi:MAG: acetyl-CoA C-acyltransferase [Chitinophagales bacterium]|nr:acetyl-CoA C-acyltransferase [Chitinophagales bacterium]